MSIFTRAFWSTAAETAIASGATAFLGVWARSNALSVNDLKAAGIAFGGGALYAFIKQLAAVRAVNFLGAVAKAKS